MKFWKPIAWRSSSVSCRSPTPGMGRNIAEKVTKYIYFQGYEDQDVQLQRIISRCKCQFFYADYGEADPNTLPHVPLPVSHHLQIHHKRAKLLVLGIGTNFED